MKFVKTKPFYLSLISIALPLALQNLISFSVGLMDTLMVGKLGEAQLSGVSVANQPFFVFNLIIFGLASGASVLCSQYWGKNNTDAIRRIFSIVIRFAFIISCVFFAIVQLFPTEIMRFYTQDPEVLGYAVSYLKLTSFTYFFFSISATYMFAMRSVENVKISLMVYIISFFVNIFFNYIFIFGKLGAPAMGSDGAAVGTLIARILEFVIIVVYFSFIENKVEFRAKDLLLFDKVLLKDFIKYSSPVVCNEFFWSLGITITVAILSQLGTSVIAANTIATTVSQMVTVFMFGVANAAVVIVGKEIGAGNIKYAKDCTLTLQVIAVGVGVVLMFILLLIKGFVIEIYNLEGSSVALTDSFLVTLSIIMPFQAFSATGIIGTLRAGGDTKFGLICDMVMIWCFAIPLSALAAFVFNWPAHLVFFIIKSEEIVKTFIVFYRLKSGKWLNVVTRDEF